MRKFDFIFRSTLMFSNFWKQFNFQLAQVHFTFENYLERKIRKREREGKKGKENKREIKGEKRSINNLKPPSQCI